MRGLKLSVFVLSLCFVMAWNPGCGEFTQEEAGRAGLDPGGDGGSDEIIEFSGGLIPSPVGAAFEMSENGVVSVEIPFEDMETNQAPGGGVSAKKTVRYRCNCTAGGGDCEPTWGPDFFHPRDMFFMDF